MAHRSHILISGDPISLSRGTEAIKAAFDAELAFYALTDEVAVAFTGDLRVAPAQLPAAIAYPEGIVYGPINANDAPLIVSEHLYKGRIVDLRMEPVDLPNGESIELEIVRHAEAAAVVAQIHRSARTARPCARNSSRILSEAASRPDRTAISPFALTSTS